jgi:hypothetical protein
MRRKSYVSTGILRFRATRCFLYFSKRQFAIGTIKEDHLGVID